MNGAFRALRLPIQSRRLLLRLPRRSDTDELARAISDRRIARATLRIPFPYHRSDAAAWITRSRQKRSSGEAVSLLTLERAGERIVGGASLFAFDREHARAELGYWITPSAWGQGYAPEAAYALSRAAFRDLKLHRIEAGTFEFNEASGRVLGKVGFVREGLAREDIRKAGAFHNTVRYGVLRSELHPPRTVAGDR
jgi:RimJ/RimL family protein N-acetyltransferase